jgi:subtilase family serine protease
MVKKTALFCIVFILLLFNAITSPAVMRQLPCYMVPATDRVYPIGPMAPDAILRLAISLPLRHRAEFDQLTQSMGDPKSPHYRHFLSPQEIAERFGPTEEDYNALITYFKQQGFTITSSPNRTLLDIAGTVKIIETTFHTTLKLYKHPTENRNFYAAGENPSIDLDIPISNIAGLDNFVKFRPALSQSPLKP